MDNKGKRLTKEEDDDLIYEVNNLIPLEKIAENHKRGLNGIKLRIIQNCIYPIINEDYKHISSFYSIDQIAIDNYINKLSNPPIKSPPKKSQRNIIEQLNDIEKKLDKIIFVLNL